MGKREAVKRDKVARDFYPTVDPSAATPLLPFLSQYDRYIEPCAGDGSLIRLLAAAAPHMGCLGAYDIEPLREGIVQRNCLSLTSIDVTGADCFVTNPPFTFSALQPILDTLPALLPTWLLLPADVIHNKRMSPYMDFCTHVVSVGRLYWFKDKPIKGVDNFVWLCFDTHTSTPYTKFHGRLL
jgi:hypothetical protein